MTTRSKSAKKDQGLCISIGMQCEEDELSQAQKDMYENIERERKEFMMKLDQIVASRNGKVIEKGKYITIHQLETPPSAPIHTAGIAPGTKSVISPSSVGLIKPAPTSSLLATPPASLQTLLSKSVFVQSGARNASGTPMFGSPNTQYKLLVVPNVGNSPSPQGIPAVSKSTSFVVNNSQITSFNKNPGINKTPVPNNVRNITPNVAMPQNIQVPNMGRKVPLTGNLSQKVVNTQPQLKVKPTNSLVTKPATPVIPAANTRSKSKPTDMPVNHTAVRKTGPNKVSDTVVDLTDDDNTNSNVINNIPEADSREVAFSRFPGKTFPSLVVVARPNIKLKDMTSSEITQERATLDTKVKSILVNSPTKFTEWLLQQGLLCCEQSCTVHVDPNMERLKFKLGMYSDSSKFPHSGGYVWISDCCPGKFVSVFHGSIFEGSPHAPGVLLKLIYHWACQTSINNIISWVKTVDNLYVKNFFTHLRAVCTAAICQKYDLMGGPQKKIEVGVISLGTTSTDGQMKQVKVEVLGVMDPETKYVRLRAVDPVQNGDRNYKERFGRILKCLEQWVHKDTIILTDYTVDKSSIIQLGFPNIIQAHLNTPTKDSNQVVMDYLKRIVPRMFQNTLSLLNTRIIQQFLDELVWRERWGPIASRAFDNIIEHIIEQTKLDTGDSLLNRLQKISLDPFKDWQYCKWKQNVGYVSAAKKQMVQQTPKSDSVATPPAKKQCTSSVNTPVTTEAMKCTVNSTLNPMLQALVSLENYYYGLLPPDNIVITKLKKITLNMKCPVCGISYDNNIMFMKHLIGHALNEGAFATDHQCKYCLKNFTSMEQLDDHMALDHSVPSNMVSCLICEEKFTQRTGLIGHMQWVHTKLELPYQCSICKYRSSEHKKLVDHFYEVHDGGDKVQCPLCLKVVMFINNGRKIQSNVSFFISHVQRHQKKYSTHKCDKCVLKFVKKSFLKIHRSKEHMSCSVPGVVRQANTVYDTMMPVPPSVPKDQKKGKLFPLAPISNYSINKFENITRPLKPNSICFECAKPIGATNHFSSYFSCMRCIYSTCCKDAMIMHIDMIHDLKISYTIEPYKCADVMYCACGFSSSLPDECATHLVNCNKKTVYSSAAVASINNSMATQPSASFPALVHLDDDDDNNQISDEESLSNPWFKTKSSTKSSDSISKKPEINDTPPTAESCMLNFLGLMRRASADNTPLESDALSDKNNEISKSNATDSNQQQSIDTVNDTSDVISDQEKILNPEIVMDDVDSNLESILNPEIIIDDSDSNQENNLNPEIANDDGESYQENNSNSYIVNNDVDCNLEKILNPEIEIHESNSNQENNVNSLTVSDDSNSNQEQILNRETVTDAADFNQEKHLNSETVAGDNDSNQETSLNSVMGTDDTDSNQESNLNSVAGTDDTDSNQESNLNSVASTDDTDSNQEKGDTGSNEENSMHTENVINDTNANKEIISDSNVSKNDSILNVDSRQLESNDRDAVNLNEIDKQVDTEYTQLQKNEDTVAKIIESDTVENLALSVESSAMETDEPSPFNDKMDVQEEVPSAMDIEDSEDMVVDIDLQDSMSL